MREREQGVCVCERERERDRERQRERERKIEIERLSVSVSVSVSVSEVCVTHLIYPPPQKKNQSNSGWRREMRRSQHPKTVAREAVVGQGRGGWEGRVCVSLCPQPAGLSLETLSKLAKSSEKSLSGVLRGREKRVFRFTFVLGLETRSKRANSSEKSLLTEELEDENLFFRFTRAHPLTCAQRAPLHFLWLIRLKYRNFVCSIETLFVPRGQVG